MLEDAHALIRQGRLAEAEQLLERQAAAGTAGPEHMRLLAKLALHRDDPALAMARMRLAMQGLEQSALAQYERGVIAVAAGDRDEAEQAFLTATRLEPGLADAHYNLGCLYREAGRNADARSAFTAATQADPRHGKAWLNLANIRFETYDTAAAAEAYEEAGKDPALRPRVLINLGTAYRALGRLADSERVLTEYLAQAPASADGHYRYGVTLAMLERLDEAMAHLRRVLDLEPDHCEAPLHLARCLLLGGARDEALRIADTELARGDLPRTVVNGYAILLTNAGLPERAIPEFERTLDADPMDRATAGGLEGAYKALERKVLAKLQVGPAEPDAHGLDPFAAAMTEKVEMHRGKNLLWFNTRSSRHQEKSHFLVLTSGNCGAIWFASALNLNEEIFSSCGIDHPIESCFRYNMQKDGVAMLRASRPHHYRHGAHPEVMSKVLADHGMDIPFPPRRYHRLGWFVFDELEDLPGAAQCASLGSVHGLIADQFSRYYMRDPAILGDRRVVVANMIRHPLARLESSIKAFVNYHLGENNSDIDAYVLRNREEFRRLERAYGISTDDPRVRAAIYMYRIGNTLEWVAEELRRFRFMTALRMEDLQSDPDYFADAVSMLTSGRVIADADHLEKVYRPENLGVGRRGNIPDGTRPPGPEDQWNQWSDWERAEFAACIRRDGIAQVYAEHGYDLSYAK